MSSLKGRLELNVDLENYPELRFLGKMNVKICKFEYLNRQEIGEEICPICLAKFAKNENVVNFHEENVKVRKN